MVDVRDELILQLLQLLGLLDRGSQIADGLLVRSSLGQNECGKEPLEDECNSKEDELQFGPGHFKSAPWRGEQEESSGQESERERDADNGPPTAKHTDKDEGEAE